MTNAVEIASIIKQQITPGVLMSLGAHNLRSGTMHHEKACQPLPGLVFNARILPFRKDGKRSSQPRIMQVMVLLDPSDTYLIDVSYRPRRYDRANVTHFHTEGVYAADLSRILLALDSDDDRAA